MKQKAFLIIIKGISLKQIKQFFLEGESSTLKNKYKPIKIHNNNRFDLFTKTL